MGHRICERPQPQRLAEPHEGDEVQLVTPGGAEKIEVVAVRYPAPAG